MNEEDSFSQIGTTDRWGDPQLFGLYQADRRQHTYVIGKTGTGKSTLLRNLIVQDIEAGRGVGVIDPHGELVEELLDLIPPQRVRETVYFNPPDLRRPIGLNLFRQAGPANWHLVASAITNAFKARWRDSWGPRLEFTLYASVAALLQCQNTTLLGVQRMLSDIAYREWVVRQVSDPAVKAFWLHEFPKYDKGVMGDILSAIGNKVGQLTMSPPIRNILGQVEQTVNFRFLMDGKRIFLANLSKGQVGEDKSNLLGAFLLSGFEHAALSRADIPERERIDFNLYLDEFQNISTETFASLLSEARKYRLCLTLSHQYGDQLGETTRAAVFGNVGSMIIFRIGHRDAKVFEEELGGGYVASHLGGLENHEVCARLLVSGKPQQPFLGKTLPPCGTFYGRRGQTIRASRQRFGKRRRNVEEKIRRWLNRGQATDQG